MANLAPRPIAGFFCKTLKDKKIKTNYQPKISINIILKNKIKIN